MSVVSLIKLNNSIMWPKIMCWLETALPTALSVMRIACRFTHWHVTDLQKSSSKINWQFPNSFT